MPNFLSELLPFNIVRMIHTNALIVWLLLGFFGATYYLLPEEAERDIESPLLAYAQFWIFFGAAAVAVVGYLFRIHEGREFLEQPIYVKIALIVGIPDVPLQHQHDGAEGPQDGGHHRAAVGPVGRGDLLPVRLLQSGQSRRSTRCTGGTSSTSGSRACGS